MYKNTLPIYIFSLYFTDELIDNLVECTNSNFMAHSAVWGHLPSQRQNTNSKNLMIKKLSKSGLRRFIEFGEAHSNDERKITLSLNLHFILYFRI